MEKNLDTNDSSSSEEDEATSTSSLFLLRVRAFKRKLAMLEEDQVEEVQIVVTERRAAPMPLLAEINRHPKDQHIEFSEEGHRYWIKGKSDGVVSTTTLLHSYCADFDPEQAVRSIFRSARHLYDPTYPYYEMNKETILGLWAEKGRRAAEEGTRNHAQIEQFYNGQVCDLTTFTLRELFYNQFHKDHMSTYRPWRTEMLIYHEALLISGSVDIIFQNRETGKLALMDWKFIQKLTQKNGYQKMKRPVDHLDDCNGNKYALQLSVYRYILETEYGLEGQFESQQHLVILHQTQGQYQKVELPYLKEEVRKIFDERKRQLQELRAMAREDRAVLE